MTATKQNGYVRWGPLGMLLVGLASLAGGLNAYIISQHAEREAHAGAQKAFVRKEQFKEHCRLMEHFIKENGEQHSLIVDDLKEIRKELKK